MFLLVSLSDVPLTQMYVVVFFLSPDVASSSSVNPAYSERGRRATLSGTLFLVCGTGCREFRYCLSPIIAIEV
ncbi:hypothetical protein BDZ97DRAFT_1781270, partial [Flammula alnicola]